ncbi:MAG TPA: hypothetical protein VIK72_06420 [Clostridiaceae bacterium]
MIKLLCKCGNIEELESDKPFQKFSLKNCGDGSIAIVCKDCNEIVLIKMNDK